MNIKEEIVQFKTKVDAELKSFLDQNDLVIKISYKYFEHSVLIQNIIKPMNDVNKLSLYQFDKFNKLFHQIY